MKQTHTHILSTITFHVLLAVLALVLTGDAALLSAQLTGQGSSVITASHQTAMTISAAPAELHAAAAATSSAELQLFGGIALLIIGAAISLWLHHKNDRRVHITTKNTPARLRTSREVYFIEMQV